MAAVRALEAGEPGGEIAVAIKFIDHGQAILPQGTADLAMGCLVVGDKAAPGVVNNLPEGRGRGQGFEDLAENPSSDVLVG